MLDRETRMQRVLNPPPAVLANIDAVLLGDTTRVPKAEPDCRTITKTEAARRLGVSIPTVYRLVRLGRIKTVETDGANRVLLASVFDYAGKGAQ